MILKMKNNKKNNQPLVSIIIPNYNHSRYLDQSIQSALGQTYKNIEVIVNDNASTDNSIRCLKKYLSKGVIINKGAQNILNSNYRVVYERSSGKYFVLLCADDVLENDFVEMAVQVMEDNENVGVVHGERSYIDSQGKVTKLDPFFRCDFISDGQKMLPIFMMTDVGQSAQALIRRSTFEDAGCHDTEHDHFNIDKEQWFRLCMNGDYAYFQKRAAFIRVPDNLSQTSVSSLIFYQPIAMYVTLKGYVKWGRIRGYENVLAKEKEAFHKLSMESKGIVQVLLAEGKYDMARKYLLFMKLADPNVVQDKEYQLLQQTWEQRIESDETFEYGQTDTFAWHKRSYDPPEGYMPLGVEKHV